MNFHKVPARRTLIYMAQLSRQHFASFNFFSVRRLGSKDMNGD